MSTEAKKLVASGVQQGWIKAPLSGDMDPPIKNDEALDSYLKIWWRVREIELERLKLDNEWLKEKILLRTFETSERF
jgi:hypothetical protein